ncbi:TPA: tRNA (guanine-N7)-methyltransferase [Streptococcus pneumoniae]
MSVLDEEYLKNTRKVYNDFCNQADNYREIILAEHNSCIKNDEAVRNFVTSVLLSAFVSAIVSAMISLEIQTYKFVIPFIIGMIWTVVVFLMINWNYIGKY